MMHMQGACQHSCKRQGACQRSCKWQGACQRSCKWQGACQCSCKWQGACQQMQVANDGNRTTESSHPYPGTVELESKYSNDIIYFFLTPIIFSHVALQRCTLHSTSGHRLCLGNGQLLCSNYTASGQSDTRDGPTFQFPQYTIQPL